MGVITPASIVAGLNVNFLLSPVYAGTGKYEQNFRIYYALEWFIEGCLVRLALCLLEFAIALTICRHRQRRIEVVVATNDETGNDGDNDGDDNDEDDEKQL